MKSTTFTVRVDTDVKKRLERLAKSTGRSRSFLAAEAISEYLEFNEWQVAGIRRAIASLDRGEGIAHDQVKDWVTSRRSANDLPLNFHPVAIRVSGFCTPIGAGGATGDRRSWSGLRSRSPVAVNVAA